MDDRKKITLTRYDTADRRMADDVVAVESPLAVTVDGAELVTLMCTPALVRELAAGYLFSEGVVSSAGEIAGFAVKDASVDVKLVAPLDTPVSSRVRVLTSGCGGGVTFTDPRAVKRMKKLASGPPVAADAVISLMSAFRKRSPIFDETGGVHSAAVADPENILASAEDIGRHNAVDKALGACLLEGVDVAGKVLLTTGRVSSEILLKCVRCKLAVIVSRGAPTSLAVELAERFNVTLIGFARGRKMNVYTHPERLAG